MFTPARTLRVTMSRSLSGLKGSIRGRGCGRPARFSSILGGLILTRGLSSYGVLQQRYALSTKLLVFLHAALANVWYVGRAQQWTTMLRAGRYWTTSSLTVATPLPTIRSDSAAQYETSTSRPATNGPRSLTRTVTDRPVATFVTRNRVPNGNVR